MTTVVAATAAVAETCIGCNETTPRGVRELSRKRVVLRKSENSSKKKCGDASLSRLESLPDEVLVRVLCCVDHADLDQLFHVSKMIRDAAVMARKLHFVYSTPSKTAAFRNSVDLDESVPDDEAEPEAPPAPKMKLMRAKRRNIDPKKMAALSVVLFTDEGNDWRIMREETI
ncbi:unnamed protein product [Rhodiola kirilowii]